MSAFWPHCTKPDETNASFPLGKLEENTSMPSYYVDEDYPAEPET